MRQQSDDDNMDLKRSVCEALVILSDATGMIQSLALDNAIYALSTCLRAVVPGRDVECLVVRIVLRLSEEAHVYGQIIDEAMLPLLFQVLDRNASVLEIAAPVCTILERVARFARACKLDLSPYVQEPTCRGKALINAASSNAHTTSERIVQSVFQFFVHTSQNPVDMPLLVNAETIEGLLALYMSAGSSGRSTALSTDLVLILSSLSRSTIASLSLNNEDTSLPSLFLCLRNHYTNVRFASQVYALLTTYWNEQVRAERTSRASQPRLRSDASCARSTDEKRAFDHRLCRYRCRPPLSILGPERRNVWRGAYSVLGLNSAHAY